MKNGGEFEGENEKGQKPSDVKGETKHGNGNTGTFEENPGIYTTERWRTKGITNLAPTPEVNRDSVEDSTGSYKRYV